jgi:hypothetical protein
MGMHFRRRSASTRTCSYSQKYIHSLGVRRGQIGAPTEVEGVIGVAPGRGTAAHNGPDEPRISACSRRQGALSSRLFARRVVVTAQGGVVFFGFNESLTGFGRLRCHRFYRRHS